MILLFSPGTIYSTIETFEYVPENDKTFHAFYRRYEDVFNVDCKEWSNEKRYVYYSENWVQLNTVGSLIYPPPPIKKTMDLEFSETFRLLSELFGPWCNCYRRRNWTRRLEFKSWTRLIALHIALIPLGKVWIQLFSLQLWVNSRTD